jgi:hypothetical protein
MSGTTPSANVGIGLDSTTVNSATITEGRINSASSMAVAIYEGFPGIGQHTLVWLEYSNAAGTTTWYGTNGTAIIMQIGMNGHFRM